jgi:hypothetical protein
VSASQRHAAGVLSLGRQFFQRFAGFVVKFIEVVIYLVYDPKAVVSGLQAVRLRAWVNEFVSNLSHLMFSLKSRRAVRVFYRWLWQMGTGRNKSKTIDKVQARCYARFNQMAPYWRPKSGRHE